MPIDTLTLAELKLTLAKPDEFKMVPGGTYVRIAVVRNVYLHSRYMDVQFIDGNRDEYDEFIEPQETVLTIIGANDPETTYVPSAAVYGKGDLAAIVVMPDGVIKYAVSLMDFYEDINRVNFATIQGWALYDVLGGLCVDGAEDGPDSYLTFWCPETHVVTRINGDISDDDFGVAKNTMFKRLVTYFVRERTCMMPITTTDVPSWDFDTSRSGPENNPEKRISGRLHKGRYVNGFPYVELTKYGTADLLADLTCFHPVEDLELAPVHPLAGNVVDRFFDNATVIWFDDPEPTHVVVAGCWPSWIGARYIVFVEVPVYSLTGRKFMERDIVDEGLPSEEKKIVDSWCRYGDQARELFSVNRGDYINFPVHETDVFYSERLHKGLAIHAARQTGEAVGFGIMDAARYVKDGTPYETDHLWKHEGTITRTPKATEPETPHANGSFFDYDIQLPPSPDPVDVGASILFVYEWNDGAEYESQNVVDNTIEYPCYTDGINTMHRRIDLDYFCDGHYEDIGDASSGITSWSTFGGTTSNQDITNSCWHDTYRNGELRWSDFFYFRKQGNDFWGNQTLYYTFYADVDYDLFVVTKVVTDIDQGSCPLGPGNACTGTQTVYGIVIFQGTEYVVWEYVRVLADFPTVWNFWPWLEDDLPHDSGDGVGPPQRPTATPYSDSQEYTTQFWYEPFYEYMVGTLRSGYSTHGLGYPSSSFSPASMPQLSILNMDDHAIPDDLLRVNIDKEYDSFAIRFESYFENDPAENRTLKYTNNGTTETGSPTIFRFNGGNPHFNNPAATSIIELSPEPPAE